MSFEKESAKGSSERMNAADIDKHYVEEIQPRLIKGTPTQAIREWSVLAHSVMELTGPAPFGEEGNCFLWLHDNSLNQLLDMCDDIDEKFAILEGCETVNKKNMKV